jgi:hypothetical protein
MIERRAQIGRGIDQRAIKVENNGLRQSVHGCPMRRARVTKQCF